MTKFGPETCKEIIEGIKQGYPQKTAAALAGVSESTFYDWLKRGEDAKRKTKYSEFLESVKKAREHSKAHHLGVIRKAGEGDDKNRPQWQASAWYLERMFPDEFGRTQRVDMRADVKSESKTTVKDEGAEFDVRKLSAKHRAELTAVLSKIREERKAESGESGGE